MNKFELVKQVIVKNSNTINSRRRLLDVGCRGCELKPYVEELADYEGVDLYQNSEGSVNHVLDVSKGLPFSDRSFDDVVALDIVEHIDDLEGALGELVRISKRSLVVMLPNIGHSLFRLKFLRTGRISDKYDLVYGQGKDRHRWITTLSQSDKYMQLFAEDHHLELQIIWSNDSRKKKILGKIGKILGLQPELWVWASLYVMKHKDQD
jgi:hypothetical protein